MMLEAQRIRDVFTQEIVLSRIAYNVMGVVSFTVLTMLGAFIRIPLFFTPVPVTLQSFFVLLSGAVLGRRWGGLSQLFYVLLGMIGFPIFAGANAGLSYLAGPTGGYIIGFVLAAYVTGEMVRKKDNFLCLALAMGLGTGIIYLTGTLWLAWTLRIGVARTFYLGVAPFLPGDVLKVVAASLIYRIGISKNSLD